LADQTSDDVGRSAGGKWDDNAHRPRRKGLRHCDPRHDWERSSARCQMQKSTARKFQHVLLPMRVWTRYIWSIEGRTLADSTRAAHCMTNARDFGTS
jgi:hypothetical protein